MKRGRKPEPSTKDCANMNAKLPLFFTPTDRGGSELQDWTQLPVPVNAWAELAAEALHPDRNPLRWRMAILTKYIVKIY